MRKSNVANNNKLQTLKAITGVLDRYRTLTNQSQFVTNAQQTVKSGLNSTTDELNLNYDGTNLNLTTLKKTEKTKNGVTNASSRSSSISLSKELKVKNGQLGFIKEGLVYRLLNQVVKQIAVETTGLTGLNDKHFRVLVELQ